MENPNASGVRWYTTGWYLRAGAGIAISRERDRCQVVYSWKRNEYGWVVKAKSRLMARGFKQREEVEFSETFAPTVSSSCVLLLLSAIACENDLDLCHFDVNQAWWIGKLMCVVRFCVCFKSLRSWVAGQIPVEGK